MAKITFKNQEGISSLYLTDGGSMFIAVEYEGETLLIDLSDGGVIDIGNYKDIVDQHELKPMMEPFEIAP